MFVCVSVRVCMYKWVSVFLYLRWRVCVRVWICVCVNICVYICTYVSWIPFSGPVCAYQQDFFFPPLTPPPQGRAGGVDQKPGGLIRITA